MSYDPWPIIWPGGTAPQTSQENLDLAAEVAREMLWSRTGRRLGTAIVTELYVVPTAGRCPIPYLADDRTWETGTPGLANAIFLTQQPAHSVLEVKIDDAVLDAAGYRLDGPRLLRLGSDWPVASASNQPPRISVRYRWGISLADGSPWATLAGLAMGEVATEVLKAIAGEPCKLPSRVVSITRAGVTMQLGDPATFVKEGLLGLTLADQLILSANPGRLAARSRVYSPDMPRSTPIAAP